MSLSKVSLLVAISATLWVQAVASQDGGTFSTADELEIRQTIRAVKNAILKEDVRTLRRHISDEGLLCTDTNYSAKKVRAFLENKNSYLYMSLFDSSRFSAECGGQYPSQYSAISDREFLQTASDSVMIVRLSPEWAQVTLTSPNSHHAQAPDCSDPKALAAERGLDDLKTWGDLHAAFRKFQDCDDGAIAEGWDDFVARMLARNWRAIAELQHLVARDSGFRLFVVRHISETADDNDLRRALSNARDHCPRSARRLCVQIAAAARNALPNP